MIGIGGIGISALAQFLINHGKKITANANTDHVDLCIELSGATF
jgi:UDP-N-acetylmuramate-alanine ligase